VRNLAAHSVEGFSFENANVQKHLSSLALFDQVLNDIENNNVSSDLIDEQVKKITLTCKRNKLFTGRARYNYTVAILYGYLSKGSNNAMESTG